MSSAAIARLRRSLGLTPAYASGSSTLATAVVRGMRLNAWKMNPMSRFRARASCASERVPTSTPSSLYDPKVGTSSAPRMFIRVDLPEPDEPMIAT